MTNFSEIEAVFIDKVKKFHFLFQKMAKYLITNFFRIQKLQ